MSDQKAYGTVLIRAKAILDELLKMDYGLTLKELSDGLGESKSTTLKVLNTMQLTGMIRRDEADKRYYMGSAMVVYGDKARKDFNLVQVARPFLKKLLAETNETVNLGLEENSKVVFIDKLESTQNVHLNSIIGGSMNMYSSSMGKALLSTKSPDQLDQYFEMHELEKVTKKTIVDEKELRKQLDEANKNGYALEWGENQDEVVCIGAALVKRGSTLGAFSISVPEYRMDDKNLDRLKKIIVSTKASIEAVL